MKLSILNAESTFKLLSVADYIDASTCCIPHIELLGIDLINIQGEHYLAVEPARIEGILRSVYQHVITGERLCFEAVCLGRWLAAQ